MGGEKVLKFDPAAIERLAHAAKTKGERLAAIFH
jgi:hypothetical protein